MSVAIVQLRNTHPLGVKSSRNNLNKSAIIVLMKYKYALALADNKLKKYSPEGY